MASLNDEVNSTDAKVADLWKRLAEADAADADMTVAATVLLRLALRFDDLRRAGQLSIFTSHLVAESARVLRSGPSVVVSKT